MGQIVISTTRDVLPICLPIPIILGRTKRCKLLRFFSIMEEEDKSQLTEPLTGPSLSDPAVSRVFLYQTSIVAIANVRISFYYAKIV
jgi:hypothetical protein